MTGAEGNPTHTNGKRTHTQKIRTNARDKQQKGVCRLKLMNDRSHILARLTKKKDESHQAILDQKFFDNSFTFAFVLEHDVGCCGCLLEEGYRGRTDFGLPGPFFFLAPTPPRPICIPFFFLFLRLSLCVRDKRGITQQSKGLSFSSWGG